MLDRWLPVSSLSDTRAYVGAVVGPDGRLFAESPSRLSYYGPAITVTPRSASAGATVLVSGTNFAANARVDLHVGTTAIASGTTDGNGALNTPISGIIPAGTPPGTYQVIAIDDRSRYPVHIPFTVNP
jgi:hypothetical protein